MIPGDFRIAKKLVEEASFSIPIPHLQFHAVPMRVDGRTASTLPQNLVLPSTDGATNFVRVKRYLHEEIPSPPPFPIIGQGGTPRLHSSLVSRQPPDPDNWGGGQSCLSPTMGVLRTSYSIRRGGYVDSAIALQRTVRSTTEQLP